MGYELVDVQASNGGRLLRLFIDKPGGVTLDDCAAVSRQLTRVLAVEGWITSGWKCLRPGWTGRCARRRISRASAGTGPRSACARPTRAAGASSSGVLRGAAPGQREMELEGQMVALALDDVDGRGWYRNCEERVAVNVAAGNRELVMLVDVLAREKNVPRDIVFGALEMALASATKKKYTEDIDVRVAVDKNTGAYETFRRWRVLPDDAPDWNTAQMLSVEEAQDAARPTPSSTTSSRSRSRTSSSAASARRPPSR